MVDGTINAFNVHGVGGGLSCEQFAARVQVTDAQGTRPFSMDEYIRTFDPAVWGWREPSGPLEEARVRAAELQRARVQQRIGSNVTIMGLGSNARIVGAHLQVQGVSNVIIRNLRVSNAHDCFPQWDPTDGSSGNWNALYDNISVHTSRNVWVDHVTLDDGNHPPSSLPTVFGRPFEVHDGLLDVTHESDLVTVSYSVLRDHDKTNLIGSADNRQAQDGGKLRVTWHHNLWHDAGQRLPRVRFGDVDLYNNVFRVSDAGAGRFDYAWGVGVQSSIVATANAFELPTSMRASRVMKNFGGTQILATQTLVNGTEIDALATYNAANPNAALSSGARWNPDALGLRPVVHDVGAVTRIVEAQAGAGRLTP